MNVDQVLDAKGLACPMPIVKTKKAMNNLETGQILEVQTTDKGAKSDLTAWTKSTGHILLDSKEEDSMFTFYIQKG
ncbi:sulfurtransferase TusA family protein [Domibacillus sp. A3M-37]|uniref:sulfurtransferase TusA family protein n=1 Tax=Domibacillus sp. A3M-37 TaxID=2962037 RepID=UPI0020B870E8|nr:sulfurtransferase TusA family protein [Domibacillus sp. A3M-37]MCP3764978.1 sulfurtransferase TusA family protein [Domibacillus sp. A3M-37]